MDSRQLDHIPLFEGLGRRARQRVAQAADEVDVAAGDRLATEGDLAYEFFVVEEGRADVEVRGERIDTLGPGDFFGEIGVFEEERRRTATVTAATPMRLMVLTGHQFRTLSRDLPEIERTVRAAVQARLSTH